MTNQLQLIFILILFQFSSTRLNKSQLESDFYFYCDNHSDKQLISYVSNFTYKDYLSSSTFSISSVIETMKKIIKDKESRNEMFSLFSISKELNGSSFVICYIIGGCGIVLMLFAVFLYFKPVLLFVGKRKNHKVNKFLFIVFHIIIVGISLLIGIFLNSISQLDNKMNLEYCDYIKSYMTYYNSDYPNLNNKSTINKTLFLSQHDKNALLKQEEALFNSISNILLNSNGTVGERLNFQISKLELYEKFDLYYKNLYDSYKDKFYSFDDSNYLVPNVFNMEFNTSNGVFYSFLKRKFEENVIVFVNEIEKFVNESSVELIRQGNISLKNIYEEMNSEEKMFDEIYLSDDIEIISYVSTLYCKIIFSL